MYQYPQGPMGYYPHNVYHTGVGMYPGYMGLPFVPPETPTVQELQLSGACDWYKIQRLVEVESKLIKLLYKDGLRDPAMKLESMRDDLLAHRMASTLSDNKKLFLKNNCANDAYISKWRKDIDGFYDVLSKALKKQKLLPEHMIELKYQGQLLKQQARASLPFTGYYNAVPKTPSIKPGTYKPHNYEPRFVYHPDPPRPELLTKLSSFF
jgi:hypothetical protein